MTREEKELLLQDLCARLPYRVIVHFHDIDVDDYERQLIGEDIDFIELDRRFCKPYLRPMYSMTEEEQEKYRYGFGSDIYGNIKRIDWLNAHHFDYRELIEKGLALEAPKRMYKSFVK